MKTRDDIYREETADILRVVKTYQAIRFEQALMLFPKKEDTIRTMIRTLIKQKRLHHDLEKDLLCDRPESALSPDYGMIASLWVLLDFKKNILYHTSSDFPVKITFFAQEEVYEIIYIPQDQEPLLNHALSTMPGNYSSRFIVLESEAQVTKVSIPATLAYCIVTDGTVNYYQKGGHRNE